jgi:hypothetical protein
MKFMVTWKIAPNCYKAAVDRFLSTGAPAPKGLKTIGRWHAPGSASGWHVVEGDATAVAELQAVWGDLLETQVAPVIEDEEAGSSLARAQGK